MIDSLAGYQSPSMISDTETRDSLKAFITEVLQGVSNLARMSPSILPTRTSRLSAPVWTNTSWDLRPCRKA